MKFNVTVSIDLDETKFLKALENAEFCCFDDGMDNIKDIIKQTVATDISLNNNIKDNGFVNEAWASFKSNGQTHTYHVDSDPVS